MGQYNPSNMYRPLVAPDTQGIAPGIAAAGAAIADGLKGFASNRAASQAADLEFDMFQKMYPGAAQMMDPEKFHSANLAGKQKMLGMGKGFVLEQSQLSEAAKANSFKERALAQDALNADRRFSMDAQTLGLNTQKFGLDAAQSVQASQLSAEELKLRERGMSLQELRANRPLVPQKVTTPDGKYSFFMDPNGNAMRSLPVTQIVDGKEVPVDVSKFAGKVADKAPKVSTIDGKSMQWDPVSKTFVPPRTSDPASSKSVLEGLFSPPKAN